MVNTLNAVIVQRLDLVQGDRAATAGEYADVVCAALFQQVDHVAEVLVVPALVAGDCYGIGVFLDRRADNIHHAAVVAQVNHLGALRLDQAAHDVDGGIVAIKQAGSGDKTQRRGCLAVRLGGFGNLVSG